MPSEWPNEISHLEFSWSSYFLLKSTASCHGNQPQPSCSESWLWDLAAQQALRGVWGFFVWLVVFWGAGRINLSHWFIYFLFPLHCCQLVRSHHVCWVSHRRMIIINPSQTEQMQPAILWLLGIHLCRPWLGTLRKMYTAR